MYWFLFKIVVLTFVPLPVNPKITRPDPKKNFWNFSCDEFKSSYQIMKMFYIDNVGVKTA
jgi:hypothetical protein